MLIKSARTSFSIFALLLVVVLASCSNAPVVTPFPSRDDSQIDAPSIPAEPTGTPLPSDGTSPDGPVSSAISNPSIEPTDPDLLGDFGCDLPYSAGLEMASDIQDVRVGTHEGFDRVVFEFDGPIPAFELDIVEAPLTEDPSGREMTVAGDKFLRITMQGTSKMDEQGDVVYDGDTEFVTDFPRLAEVEEGGDFERVSTWYIGLNGTQKPCFRALEFSSPSRLVIDLEQ